MQDPLLQQIQLGAAIAQALDQLDPADLAFTLTRAPRRGQRSFDSVVILAKTPSYRLERREVGGLGLLEPVVERCRVTLGQESLKAALELIPLDQQGVCLQEALQSFPVRLAQASGRPQEQPCALWAPP